MLFGFLVEILLEVLTIRLDECCPAQVPLQKKLCRLCRSSAGSAQSAALCHHLKTYAGNTADDPLLTVRQHLRPRRLHVARPPSPVPVAQCAAAARSGSPSKLTANGRLHGICHLHVNRPRWQKTADMADVHNNIS